MQLTIRGLPKEVTTRLKAEASRRKWSLNRTVVYTLEKATGVAPQSTRHNDLDDFFGQWTENEAQEFDAILQDMRRVDDKLWR